MHVFLAASLLSPDFGLIIWIALTFLLLLVLLRRLAWGPIANALKERERRIEESIDSAERALAEAKQIQEENARALRESEEKAQQILRKARESADSIRSDEIEKTRQQLARMQEQAEEEIERGKEGALAELRREVADLAIRAAEKILDESIDEKKQRRLINDFLKDLPEN